MAYSAMGLLMYFGVLKSGNNYYIKVSLSYNRQLDRFLNLSLSFSISMDNQLIIIHFTGSFYQSLLENPVTLPLNQTKDFYLSLSYNFSLMAENYSVFYYDSSVVQVKFCYYNLIIIQFYNY